MPEQKNPLTIDDVRTILGIAGKTVKAGVRLAQNAIETITSSEPQRALAEILFAQYEAIRKTGLSRKKAIETVLQSAEGLLREKIKEEEASNG